MTTDPEPLPPVIYIRAVLDAIGNIVGYELVAVDADAPEDDSP